MEESGIQFEFEQGETLEQLEAKAVLRSRAGWTPAGPPSEVSVKLTPDIFTTRYSQTFKRAGRRSTASLLDSKAPQGDKGR